MVGNRLFTQLCCVCVLVTGCSQLCVTHSLSQRGVSQHTLCVLKNTILRGNKENKILSDKKH